MSENLRIFFYLTHSSIKKKLTEDMIAWADEYDDLLDRKAQLDTEDEEAQIEMGYINEKGQVVIFKIKEGEENEEDKS